MRSFISHVLAVMLLSCATLVAAEDGVSADEILIGQTVGITGTVAAPVKEMNEGALAYFQQVNKQGGVFGRKIKLLTLDDKFDPAQTLVNAKTLIHTEKVFALFQGRGTPHNQGILPLLEESKVPLVGPATGATVFHEPVNKWLFNIRANYHVEIAEIVKYMNTTAVTSIALLHVDDAFGRDGLEGFNKSMLANKLTPVSITKFARVKPDYDAAATAVIQTKPAALIILSSAKNTVEVIKAIRAPGSTIQIYTLSNNSSESFVKDLGAAGVGVIVSQVTPAPHLRTTTLGTEFNRAAKESGATISYPSMEGYMNAKVLVEGLRRAGKNLTRAGFVQGMEAMRRTDFGGLMVTYGPDDHTGSEFVELTMIGRNGKFLR